MHVSGDYKRLICIEGTPGRPYGMAVVVKDAETGEDITNITSIIIYLDARQESRAEITYHEMDGSGKFTRINSDGEFAVSKTTLPVAKIENLPAFELHNWEEVFDREFTLYEPTEDYEYENVEEKVKAFIRSLLKERGK